MNMDLRDYFFCDMNEEVERDMMDMLHIDEDEAAEMTLSILRDTKESLNAAGDISTWQNYNLLDRILWVVTEAYVRGGLFAFRVMAEANKRAIEYLKDAVDSQEE